jgi:hypothetical protein
MSLPKFIVFLMLPACGVVSPCLMSAETWMTGSVVIESIEGSVSLEVVGADSVELNVVEIPQYTLGLLRVRAEGESAVLLRTSNQISIYNAGPGFFAIERFEQMADARIDLNTNGEEQGQSHMILHLREGELVVDSRKLNEASQLIIEVPMGRISVRNGWWLMRISKNERTQIYNYSIECADGVLRFTDRLGASYTLRGGQRLSGVGSSERPSIEVAEITEEGREAFDRFSARLVSVSTAKLSWAAFQEEMKPTINLSTQVDPVISSARKSESDKRPLLIEYAPQSSPVTQFRAVIRPPSAGQADLF